MFGKTISLFILFYLFQNKNIKKQPKTQNIPNQFHFYVTSQYIYIYFLFLKKKKNPLN
jgi:hypothetical protein